MNKLIKRVGELRKGKVKAKVEKRLSEFRALGKKGNKEWFSELCFCILTANSRARSAINIQKEMGARKFCECARGDIVRCIKRHKHRFHNTKAEYIIKARKFVNIKNEIRLLGLAKGAEARQWLVDNIKGIGYKEASHFLRNVGYFDLAILDRHILNLMVENGFLKRRPKSLNKANYMDIEKKFRQIAAKLRMKAAELDLYMWYMKTGEVLK
jgi:N-glycosylase/DNA lyase